RKSCSSLRTFTNIRLHLKPRNGSASRRSMVPRYSRPEMTAIWSAENRYRIWWQIEVFAAEAMGRIGMIPSDDAATIRAAYDRDALGEIDIAAIDAIEAVTKHDVIAFLTWTGEKIGPDRPCLH